MFGSQISSSVQNDWFVKSKKTKWNKCIDFCVCVHYCILSYLAYTCTTKWTLYHLFCFDGCYVLLVLLPCYTYAIETGICPINFQTHTLPAQTIHKQGWGRKNNIPSWDIWSLHLCCSLVVTICGTKWVNFYCKANYWQQLVDVVYSHKSMLHHACQTHHIQRWEWRKSQKTWKWGAGGRRSPVDSRSKRPGGVQGAWRLFLNLRYENPHFLALYPVAKSHSQNALYCSLRLSSRGTNQA